MCHVNSYVMIIGDNLMDICNQNVIQILTLECLDTTHSYIQKTRNLPDHLLDQKHQCMRVKKPV